MPEINPVEAIFGIIVLVIFGSLIIGVLSSVSNSLNPNQCKPFEDKANQLQVQVDTDKGIIDKTNSLLQECNQNYTLLANSTITRSDFEEVKGYFNLTRTEMSGLNSKIDNLKPSYSFYDVKITNYSLAFNFTLTLEIISLLFLKSEFVIFSYRKIKKKINQWRLNNETTNISNTTISTSK